MNKIVRNELIEWFLDEMPIIRQRLHISQTDLGNMIGVSRQTISSIERREVQLTWDKYLAFIFAIHESDNIGALGDEFEDKYEITKIQMRKEEQDESMSQLRLQM